jgi:hypothetical protein
MWKQERKRRQVWQWLKRTCTIVLALLGGACCVAASENEARRAAVASIRTDQLMNHVEILADDTFEGREAGRRGGRAAAKYLLPYISRYLRPAGVNGGFAQPFGADYQNLLGLLIGSDPQLRREYILVGAHYDHVGYGNRANSNGPIGFIHNGADDNASGTAALLELMEAFSHLDTAPKRSIIFALWDGEEKGLLGSEHWSSFPTVPLSQTKLAINMDMLGRLGNKPVEVIGSRSAPGLRQMISEANQSARLAINFTWTVEDNSDHHTFFRRGIPILMLHSGLHSDYHTPRDDAHLIDANGLNEVTRLAFDIVLAAAERADIPTFRSASRFENENDRRRFETPLPSPAPRLGISWKAIGESESRLMEVSSVLYGSPAHRAGLVTGDRILSLNDVPINDSATFQLAVQEATSPAKVVYQRPGNPQTTESIVDLAGKPVRIGISWREDDGDPGTVTVVRVIGGSPADRCGLKLRDRILTVNGQPFKNSREFQALITRTELPIEFSIERQGIVSTVMMKRL